MWSIKILTGQLAGQNYPLREGENLLGRGSDCDIVLSVPGVSKHHARITVHGGTVSVTDLGSSNGTSVNGHIIQHKVLESDDRIAISDLLIAIVPTQARQSVVSGNLALKPDHSPAQNQAGELSPENWKAPTNLNETIHHYVENVAMPGIYRLIELFEYKNVIGTFIAVFVLAVTILATIPMISVSKSSIEAESRRRALTIARNLALLNQPAIQQGMESTLTTEMAEREEGVESALIISSRDGAVMAPQNKAGSYAADLRFVHRARKSDREQVEQLDSQLIGASVPIRSFNSEMGGYSVIAHAIVLYDMGSLSLDSGRIISLFTQILLIAAILGTLLWFFLYRMTLRPITELKARLDQALLEGHEQVETPYHMKPIQDLGLSISSALRRSIQGSSNVPDQNSPTRNQELENLVRLFSHAAIALDGNENIISFNTAFEDLTGMRLATLQQQPLEALSDQALKLSIADLLEQAKANPHLIASRTLDFNDLLYEIDAQLISGPRGPEGYLITFRETGGTY